MAGPLSADAGLGNFHAASVTDDAFVSDFFVLTAMALPVLAGTKDPLTVKSILLRL